MQLLILLEYSELNHREAILNIFESNFKQNIDLYLMVAQLYLFSEENIKQSITSLKKKYYKRAQNILDKGKILNYKNLSLDEIKQYNFENFPKDL